jgi:diguanylate cyclase (GGDEF)-like protein
MLALGREPRRSVFCALLALIALFSACKRTPRQTTTLTFQQIMAEDTNPAKRGKPVVTTGVVTYFDPEWHLLLLQDSTTGIYIEPHAGLELRVGDELKITGLTADPGKFLDQTKFSLLKHGNLPVPLQVRNASQFANLSVNFVQTMATVRWVGIRNGRATIDAFAGDARVTILVYPGTSENLPRIGSEINVSGVTGVAYDSNGQFQSWRLLSPSPHSIRVVRPGPQEPFSLPLAKISDLGESYTGKLVHVTGKVVDRVSSLSISDSTRAVAVNLRRPLHGDFASAEVVGFWNGSALEDALIRPTGELLGHKGDIRSLFELKHLSVAQASAAQHVSVRGVVTYFDPYWNLFFVQDSTAASFVNVSGLNLRLKPGDLVDVSGVSGPGDYAPVIRDPAISFVGRGTFPTPVNLDIVQSDLPAMDSRWCTFHSVVHSFEFVDGHTNLKLGAGETGLNLQVPTLIDGAQYLDKEITVTGALGILFNERRQAVGHQIFVPAKEFIKVVGSGGKPNPESTIAMLRRYSPDLDEHHSIGVRGVVVLKSTPNTIFVEDETGGIRVRSAAALNVNLGDHVSVRGYLRPGEYSPALDDAAVIREAPGPLPTPEHISAKSAAEGPHDSEYVSMTGVLSAVRPAHKLVTLVLNDGGTYFDVTGPTTPELNSLRIGSNLEVRGVCQVTLDRTHVPYTARGFTLAFDSPDSVTVRKIGPWWDSQKVWWALILFGMGAGAAILWASLLRRNVQAKTQELQWSLAAKRKAQQFDQARNEILENIARNAPLPESMERLALAIQDQIPDVACALLLPGDGRSFRDGKPAPMFIAPGLPEVGSQAQVVSSVLTDAVTANDKHLLSVDSELVQKLLAALRSAGVPFVSGSSTHVFSAAGSVVGMVILFSTSELAAASDAGQQALLQSASRLVSLARDHWEMHERLLHEARHDGLTGLPNRAVAEDRLEQALARAERRKRAFAVFCIDLDGFKSVNDELGHDAGDELLRIVAVRLRSRVRHSDTLARMGGDEFLAIIDDCATDAAAQSVADSLIASLEDPVVIEGRQLVLAASLGIAMYPTDGQNASQLRRAADQAMYGAKGNGGAQACFLARSPRASSNPIRKAATP